MTALLPSPPHPTAPPERWLAYDTELLRAVFVARDDVPAIEASARLWRVAGVRVEPCTIRRLLSREWVAFGEHGTRLALTESGRGVVR